MGLNRQEKADMIKEISEIIAGTEGLVIAEYRGLTVDCLLYTSDAADE